MKANPNGNSSERARASVGWHITDDAARSCANCRHYFRPGAPMMTKCTDLGVATQPHATCDDWTSQPTPETKP